MTTWPASDLQPCIYAHQHLTSQRHPDGECPTKGEVTISLKQTEFYSATFTVAEAAKALGCEPTEEAIAEVLAGDFDLLGSPLADSIFNGWDMAENSEWSLM